MSFLELCSSAPLQSVAGSVSTRCGPLWGQRQDGLGSAWAQEPMGLIPWAEKGEQLGNREPCHSPSFSARNTKLRLLVTTSNFWSPTLATREMEETGMNRLE